MNQTKSHEWVVSGPWYRWRSQEDPGWGKSSRPIFQKYAASDFVTRFLENPQRSLRYSDKDFVHSVQTLPSSQRSKKHLSSTVYRKNQQLNRRKLFLDTHSRFYLVVCELHCDAAGLPNVPHRSVCEAGFVVRRRKVPIPQAVRADLENVLRKLRLARHRLAKLGTLPDSSVEPDCKPEQKLSTAWQSARHHRYDQLQQQLSSARGELQELIQRNQLQLDVQGWFPSETDGIGDWRSLGSSPDDELPQRIHEEVLPLYPLIPDPGVRNHSSGKSSLWFGVVPTGSSDTSPAGIPRFDDREAYEVRCFVRQRRDDCPPSSSRRSCSGNTVWSAATETYQLAAHFDLDGTSNHRTTIQMPDLPALRAQVSSDDFRMGDGVGVALVSPSDSELEFGVNSDGTVGDTAVAANPSICMFAIPLITIVATFLLRLVLPIVVFMFQLWFLLKLRFCILPTFSIDADLALQLQTELDVEVSAEADLSADLQADISGAVDAMFSGQPETAKGIKDLDPRAQGQLLLDLSTDFSQDAPPSFVDNLQAPPPTQPAILPGVLPSAMAALDYYPILTEVPPR